MFKKVIISHLGEVEQETRIVGDTIHYRIYYDPPPNPSTGIVIADRLDKGLTDVTASTGGQYDPAKHAITWHLDHHLPGRRPHVDFEAVATKVKIIRNQAMISGSGIPKIKSNAVETNVVAEPKLGWLPLIDNALPGEPVRVYMKDETTMGTTVRVDIPGVYVYQEDVDGVTFHHLSVPGRAALTNVGKPELPIAGVAVEVPLDVKLKPVLLRSQTTVLEGYNVYPAQPPRIDATIAAPEFILDQAAYLKPGDYPAQPATLESDDLAIIRGHRVAFLKLNPLRYDPVTRRITAFTTMEVRLDYDRPAQLKGVQSRLMSPAFEQLLQATVLNYKDPRRFAGATLSSRTRSQGCDYLVVADNSLFDEKDSNAPLNRLCDWKRRKGYSTRVVKRSAIENGTTPEGIRKYLQDAYNSWNPAPSFVLLVGDADLLRAVPGMRHPDENDPNHPQPQIETDLYYATTDGTDYFPDMYIGRLPVDTVLQLTNVVDKILAYEQNPPATPAHAGFYTDVSLIGLFTDWNQSVFANSIDGREGRPWIANLETIHNFLAGQNYNVERIYATDIADSPWPNSAQLPQQYQDQTPLPNDLLAPNFNWNGGPNDIGGALNAGRFLTIYRGHGGWDGWARPGYDNGDVAGLNQNNLTPVIFSITCQTGWFDSETDDDTHGGLPSTSESFAETLLRRSQTGAVAVFGMTRNSYTGWNDFIIFGLCKAIWPEFNPDPPWAQHPTVPGFTPERLVRMGQILNFAKMFMANAYAAGDSRQLEFEMGHLFGDPEMPIWTRAPGELQVDHPKGIGPTGIQEFLVRVTSGGQPVANATVVLTRKNDILQTQQADSAGVARFTLDGVGAGDIDLTVTDLNFRPYMGKIAVKTGGAVLNRLDPPDGPEGQTIHVGGIDFQDNETVSITFGQLAPISTVADASGQFGQETTTVDLTVPAGHAHGPVNVLAYGKSSQRYAARVFQVRDPNPVDLWTYDQTDSSTWSVHPGDNPTWDSPDIQLYDQNNNPVASNNLVLGETYTIRVVVRNQTAFLAKQAKVVFKWTNYGAGGPWQLFNTQPNAQDVPAGPSASMTFEALFTPPATGHLCVKAEIEHIEDVNPNNNQGQENLHVGYSQSPSEVCFMVWNPTRETAPAHLEVRQLLPVAEEGQRLWATWVKHPDPQMIKPGGRGTACIVVDPEPAHVQPGAKAEFAVTVFIGSRMIGGVNLQITKQ